MQLFAYGLCTLFTKEKKLTKQTNKTVTRLAKRSFKTQLKYTLIKLKFSEAFGENNLVNWITTLESLRRFHYKAKFHLYFLEGNHMEPSISLLISLFIDFFPNVLFL